MRRFSPILFLLVGLFFLLLPFVGSTPDPLPVENNHRAAKVASLLMGAFFVSTSTYYLVKSFRSDSN